MCILQGLQSVITSCVERRVSHLFIILIVEGSEAAVVHSMHRFERLPLVGERHKLATLMRNAQISSAVAERVGQGNTLERASLVDLLHDQHAIELGAHRD